MMDRATELERQAHDLLLAASDLSHRYHGKWMPPPQQTAWRRFIARAGELRDRARAVREREGVAT